MENLFTYIGELYGIKIQNHKKVDKGFLSHNFELCCDSSKYFLKKYRFTTKEKIEEIHSVKKFFKEKGIPVIFPIINKEGITFFEFGGSYYALFPFVNGIQFERGMLPENAIESFGSMLARIHLGGKDCKLNIKDKFKKWDREETMIRIETIRSLINSKEIKDDFDDLALKAMATKEELMNQYQVSFEEIDLPSDHLIHGDYLDSNVFFDEDDNVSHVFDLEKADLSSRMFELIRCVVICFFDKGFANENFDKARLFVRSYKKVYPYTDEEIQKGLKLYFLKLIHSVWVESEHYLRQNTRIDHFLQNDYQRVLYFKDHYKDFEKVLIQS